MDIVYDMETSDPDDFFTLCFLTSHPQINLKAITINPGTKEQVGIVRYVLDYTNHYHVPIGSRDPNYEKKCVSSFHYKFLNNIAPKEPDAIAHELLASIFNGKSSATLLTGAPLHNLHLLLANHEEVVIERWVGQGGFAGDNVVPQEHRMEKFAGKITCPTFNFNGDVKGALLALSSPKIKKIMLVSKNVCHSVVYDLELHDKAQKVQDFSPGWNLLYRGMDVYLQKRNDGKKFHDPLAACVAICPEICEFAQVELYRERGQWGSNLKSDTNTWISTSVNKSLFEKVLFCQV